MTGIAKVIGRLLAVLINTGIIEGKQAEWILEPLIDKAESEEKNEKRKTL